MTLLQGQALGTSPENQQQDHFAGQVPPPDEELKMVSQSAVIIQASFIPLMALPTTRVWPTTTTRVVVQVMCVNTELKMRAGKIGKSSHKAIFCFLSEAKRGLKTWPEQLS